MVGRKATSLSGAARKRRKGAKASRTSQHSGDFCRATAGNPLHAVTGECNLAACIGHSCYIVAASAVVYNVLDRPADDDRMRALFKQYVERPATLCIPVLFATFTLGNGAAVYRPDFLDVPTDIWLSTYWLLLCSAPSSTY
jgi:hypothetical protein